MHVKKYIFLYLYFVEHVSYLTALALTFFILAHVLTCEILKIVKMCKFAKKFKFIFGYNNK